MDQQKIGKFISEKRKEKNLTQIQLGEMLNVSKNAVSKWERGICMMDISLLEPLSKILEVSVTDILNGEKVTVENNTHTSVQSALQLAEEQIKKYDTLINFILGVFCVAMLAWPYLYIHITGGHIYEIYYILYPLMFIFYVILFIRTMIKQKKLSALIIITIILQFFLMITEMKLASGILKWL